MFAPYFIIHHLLLKSSLPYTLAFSNVPGLRKATLHEGRKALKMMIYFIPAGYTGVGI